jgi:predicted site-specific integrase-resolvase
MTTPQFYTYKQLGAATGIRLGTLRQWVYKGKMPAPDLHIGRAAVWSPESIEPWLSSKPTIGSVSNRKEPAEQ